MRPQTGPRACFLTIAITAAVLATTASLGQTLDKRLGRSFDSNLYFPGSFFFTAEDPEAVLTLGHAAGRCVSALPCATDLDCSGDMTCAAGFCGASLDVQVGYVAVMTAQRFCSILACSGAILPVECAGAACDGSGSCQDVGSNLDGLCVCVGCDEDDPQVPAPDVAFEDSFDGSSTAAWALGQAEIVSPPSRSYLRLFTGTDPPGPGGEPTFPPTSVAQVRFPVSPGTQYLVFVKWTYTPTSSALNCSPFADLSLALSTGPAVCE
jgi:hypothetical protein